jgi:hypothetical protein
LQVLINGRTVDNQNISLPASLADGAWHQITATISSNITATRTVNFYVDRVLAGTVNVNVGTIWDSQTYSSYLFGGWANYVFPSNPRLVSYSDAAVYTGELAPAKIASHGLTQTTIINTIVQSATGGCQSVAVIPGETEDEVWVSVLRQLPNNQTARYIERMAPRKFATASDAFYVNCGVRYDGTPTAILSGLGHLEGQTVSILADGAVFPPQAVVGGSVTLSTAVPKASVGLPYKSILEPMRLEVPSRAGGTSHGSLTDIAEIVISLLNSGGTQYGSDLSNMNNVDPVRTTEPYGSPPALFTGDTVMTLPGAYDPQIHIIITGASPLPTTVRCIVARASRSSR